ncbi:uncharacterized protein Pyn_22174 [Prunus yedoensis var. nudiflora]|uniref:S-protein homolog n=1 Tax=Prunus yedoensis var. nudiflora TaxID=2094558 RepID=A0A314XJ96_PRUYE|nr:uncharacterized protein Pyn_22174 [Prunus yedoensis var. nudiflora]
MQPQQISRLPLYINWINEFVTFLILSFFSTSPSPTKCAASLVVEIWVTIGCNGQRFTVSFHNDKCVSAEYWCKLSWGSKSSHGGNYRFFSCEESFLKFCNFQDCSWKVRDDGIYLHDMHGLKDVKYYDWES